MEFHLFVLNREGTFMQDVALHLQRSLEDCGHRAYFSTRLVAGGCNILLAGFGPQLAAAVARLSSGSTRFIAWAPDLAAGAQGAGAQDAFAHTAARCLAVWTPEASAVPWWSQALPGARVQFFPHGFAEGFRTVDAIPEAGRDIDFCISGARNRHRIAALDALSRRHSVAHYHFMLPEFVRRDYLARARVCIALRLSDQVRLPAISRAHTLVMNGCATLLETSPVANHLDPYVEHAPWDALLERAATLLEDPGRATRAAQMRERLRAELPMRSVVPRLLDELFAGR